MATFPHDRQASKQQSAVIFIDPTCRTKATITNPTTGAPFAGSTIVVGSDGLWPLFNCAATVVYYQNPSNQIVALNPNIAASVAVVVTGSKTTGAAITSLIAGLNALGIPLTDSTS